MNILETIPTEIQTAFWTILTASLCSIMCAVLGVWLVLQKLSLVGDAISHSVLPGIVLIFIFFGTYAPLPMIIGASIAGIITILLMKGFQKLAKTREDASMGAAFTMLFALGVILITRYASQIDLDPSCVLYGLIEFVSLNTTPVFGIEIPQALLTIAPALLIVLLFLALFNKELLIMAFDPELSKTLGTRPNFIYYLLMSMVALATVASFEAVGSILVIAMLIGPAATAQLLTHQLKPMFIISGILAILSSITGYGLAVLWNTSIAGMMAVSIGTFYVLTVAYTVLMKNVQQSHLREANEI